MTEWREIDTAPKNRPILACDWDFDIYVCEWVEYSELYDTGWYVDNQKVAPTHWYDYPDPPKYNEREDY